MILSAVLLVLSLPNELFNWGNPAFGLVALVPLYVALAQLERRSAVYALGAVFGGLAHGLSSYWLWFFKDFRIWTLGSTVVVYMIVYGFFALYLHAIIRKTGIFRTVLFAAAWAVFEFGKSNGFLAYPWGLLPYSWNTVLPFIQLAEVTGIYGLTFVLALFSASVAELFLVPDAHDVFQGRCGPRGFFASVSRNIHMASRPSLIERSGPLMIASVLLLAVLGYGFLALDRPRPSRGSIHAILVQQNTDSWVLNDNGKKALEVGVSLAADLLGSVSAKPDVILFSETSLVLPWKEYQSFYRTNPPSDPLIPFLEKHRVYLFAGSPVVLDWDKMEATNSVLLIDPYGQIVESYAKIHPVPFAEAIPFWEYPPMRKFMQETVGLQSGWVMGTERVIFELPTRDAGIVKFSAPICFEDAFPYLCREFVRDGAEILVNLTNDSWSLTNSAEIQHFVAARFRTVELRRTLVRSTNGGVSAVVLPDGSIQTQLPLFAEHASMVEIPVYTGEQTPYLVAGDLFSWLLIFLLCCTILIVNRDMRAPPESKQYSKGRV